ncbi:hypothetical protein CALCODRAFT_524541 [Calocera cornea HHB12733]|uniref:Helitron helicase-like domain-containing protein n=1 Tax=Calocera cornea HHB12733 TaxID=1353952 RepID=A0A165EVG8_9BASI|nr:hypothetical protein CALCODRAFT_524541 [Calocera cornea HHB12733]
MVRFRDIILRIGGGPRLFGQCTAWYGMVEAQGQGTLHCHMLVWIEGNPSPKSLRNMLSNGTNFKSRMITWLESLIKTELPDDKEVVVEPDGPLPMPKLDKDSFPDLRACGASWRELFNAHVKLLVQQNNWHEHCAMCWIHLKRGEAQSDNKCRMRIDGTTQAHSEVDAERFHPQINEYNDYLGSGEASRAALYYITNYITKSSLKKNQEKFAQSPDAPAILLNISHQQIMSYYFAKLHWGTFLYYVQLWEKTLHNHNAQCDVLEEDNDDKSIDIGQPTVSLAPTMALNIGDGSVTAANQVQDYMYRPIADPFSDYCLYDFVRWTKKEAIPMNK